MMEVKSTLMLFSLLGGPAAGDFMATFQPYKLEANITAKE